MAESKINVKEEIKSWLEVVFKKEQFRDLLVELQGNTQKSDGYIGDVVFVHLTATTEEGSVKNYDLVLKCSKRSEILRKRSPVKEAFFNEMYVYDTLFPTFTQFQLEKGIKDPFNSMPKCYGTYRTEKMEVIVLENLKNRGYTLWDRKEPLTKDHIKLVVREYGKYHAISVAMREQQPEKFNEMADTFEDIFRLFTEKGNIDGLFGKSVRDVYDVLVDDLDEDTLEKWENFQYQADFVFRELSQNVSGLKVIIHGDCWSNNFMHKHDENGKPESVAIIDWQVAKLSSPIFDLSYFLFTCVGRDSLEEMDVILKEYYDSFSNYLKRLGNDAEQLYPFEQFLVEWRKYSKLGIFMSPVLMKICSTSNEDVPDIVEHAENNDGEFMDAFIIGVNDKKHLKYRMKPVVKYVVANELVQ